MTMQRLTVQQLLQQPLEYVLQPPAFRFYATQVSVLLASLMAVAWSLLDGQGGFELMHYVGLVFGGVLLLVSLWPASWSRQRLINLAFDAERLYLVNGNSKQVVSLPRTRVRAVNKGKLPGHDGAIIAFTLDLQLDEQELDQVHQTLETQAEERFALGEGRYRFGFVANWQPRRKLLAAIAPLAPIVVVEEPAKGDDDDEWDD
ncbi:MULTISPECIES: hypothetical protein [Oceanimonas]|uniref:Uncharacterized protein n=1 Tax=Oceanimonas doudoroffii TaxID=84158 RepID=A0A233RGZ1_9GAMM|nr:MULTISPECIES: hypothetical protein [Oceanimonas]NHI00765.1 hypothetical protein [Oceanimonas sp. MB9]OXY82655.1 hypothetical protein B6S08_03815 [Oceanimonas doudoroffii]